MREAYAAAPADTVILHTLELWHPSFRNEAGQPAPIRVVRDHADLTATLEAGAPRDAGMAVAFVALAFDLDLPPVETAAISQDKIEIIYRPYLSTDLAGPHMDPPITLTLTEVEADTLRVTGRARMLDAGNKSFPSLTYTAQRFPGLAR